MIYRIPAIGGRLLVGWPPDEEHFTRPEITHWIGLTGGDGRQSINSLFWVEELDGDPLDNRVATLKWYMAKSQEAGTVFYIYSPPKAWECVASCLMARYNWSKHQCKETISLLSSCDFVDLELAEQAFKTWRERGSNG